MRRLSLPAPLLIILLLIGCTSPFQALRRSRGEWIAYVSCEEAPPRAYVYLLRADGSRRVRLTSDPGSQLGPAWSPDGKRIAYVRHLSDSYDIWVMNADGSGQRQLTHGADEDDWPVWSPDGTRIAWVCYSDGGGDIHVIDVKSGKQMNLTRNPGRLGWPDWSPDGERLAFGRCQEGRGCFVVLQSADSGSGGGTVEVPVTSHMPPLVDWSPDGQRIAFTCMQESGDSTLYTMRSDGTQVRAVTSGHRPAWSPDGTKIAFTDEREGESDIYVIGEDGSEETRLTDFSATQWDDSAECPAWSPDGSRIAFLSTWGSDAVPYFYVYVMKADGTALTRLSDHRATEVYLSWQP